MSTRLKITKLNNRQDRYFNEKSPLNKLHDVAIVGGGIVGLTLALALAKRNFDVVLIEKNPSIEDTLQPSDFRVSAINLASQALFKSLDVWPAMKSQVSPFEKVCVFEPSKAYTLEFDSAAIPSSHLGFIAGHQLMTRVLTDKLSFYPIEKFYRSVVQSLEIGLKHATLTLETGETILSRLVVGADGMHSKLRELAGITVTERDYHQVALVAEVQTEKPHQKIARQCFRSTGPLAFLPLKDENTCSIVWSTTATEAQRLQNLSEEMFAVELEAAFEYRLGTVQLQSPRFTFPLKMRYAKRFVQPRFALAGDAIHTIHPLAGQGLNLGLLDVACLADVLQAARDKSDDIGEYAILRRYERQRKSHHVAAIAAMEMFKQGFGISIPPLAWMRERFLYQFNRMESLKRYCLGFATGLKKI